MSKFVFHELHTDDPHRAKAFYGDLFDWDFEDVPMQDGSMYSFAQVDGDGIGGIMKKQMPDQPTAWLSYVGVESVKATLAKAAELGGRIVVDYRPVMDMGAFGVMVDPTGATVAVWEDWQKPPAGGAKKKAAPKKAAPKKAAPKKAAKKAAPKKAAKKKAAPKKAAKKAAPKKVAKKKAAKRR